MIGAHPGQVDRVQHRAGPSPRRGGVLPNGIMGGYPGHDGGTASLRAGLIPGKPTLGSAVVTPNDPPAAWGTQRAKRPQRRQTLSPLGPLLAHRRLRPGQWPWDEPSEHGRKHGRVSRSRTGPGFPAIIGQHRTRRYRPGRFRGLGRGRHRRPRTDPALSATGPHDPQGATIEGLRTETRSGRPASGSRLLSRAAISGSIRHARYRIGPAGRRRRPGRDCRCRRSRRTACRSVFA